jgi:erythromycin esterase-like protein
MRAMRSPEWSREDSEPLRKQVSALARPLRSVTDLTPLLESIQSSRIVMLGEATHGTQEFYEWRTEISRELIEKHGFRFIAVEGDWPPAWRLHEFLQGRHGSDPREALRAFQRWPTWMWANTEILRLAGWMRSFNEGRAPETRCGFFGLDVYSLFESIEAAVAQLEESRPFLARKLKKNYECFEPFQKNETAYAKSLLRDPDGCLEAVTTNLRELLQARLAASGPRAPDALFSAEQNARIVANAERYYRVMVHGGEDSWNVRDRHMLETLEILLDRLGPETKAVVWAHNTHIGDHRFTDMVEQGQVNIGGLAREKWGEEAVSLVGFGTHRGSVIAARAWDGPAAVMRVPPGMEGSYEGVFQEVSRSFGLPSFFLLLRGLAAGPLHATRGHRAIGVVYHPTFERPGNYVPTDLGHRYDAFVFLEETRALEPLHQDFRREEIPETWPQGF